MQHPECSGPAAVGRPLPWMLAASVWMAALVAAPVTDALRRNHWQVPLLAVLAVLACTAAVVLAGARGRRPASWQVPGALTLLSLLAVTTTLAYGQPWGDVWILLAASLGGAWQRRAVAVPLLAVPAAASATLWAAGATGAQVWVLAVTVFLAGLANHVLVRLLRTIGALRAAQRELAGRAVLEERERFSRDLHDLLGHTLSVVVVKAEAVRRLSQRDPEAAMRHTLDIERIGRQALLEVREAVDGYRRTSLVGEVARGRMALEAAGVAADLSVATMPLPPEVDEAFAWVVREGVTNVVRHAGARTCRLSVESHDGVAVLELVDDGAGSSPDPMRPGAGLGGLRQRLAAVGGDLEATRSERGFRLAATVATAPTRDEPSVPSPVEQR